MNVITFKTASLYVPREENSKNEGARWYLDNVFEALDTLGEYYISPDCTRIYYVPRDGEAIDGFTLLLLTTEKALVIDDHMNVVRRHSQAASDVPCAIDVDHSADVAFRSCRFSELGLSGIGIDNGSHHIT